jgi:hypothetical protein
MLVWSIHKHSHEQDNEATHPEQAWKFMLHFTMFPTPCAARTVETTHHIIYLHNYCFNTNIHPESLSHFHSFYSLNEFYNYNRT